jgi:DNA-binding NarL/FixJ family response regulator
LAVEGELVQYVMIDDEVLYRQRALPPSAQTLAVQVGSYGTVEAFLGIQAQACHVVVLDLCLNRLTGDAGVLQGVQAVRLLTEQFGLRVLVHTADERADPVARCVAAGAAGYISKFAPDQLALAVVQIGRHGRVVTPALDEALRSLARRSLDVRLSAPLEETLVLLGRGLSDAQVAAQRHLSHRTVEDHKRKILVLFGEHMEAHRLGFAGLTRELGLGSGDVVNDSPGGRPARGVIRMGMPWAPRGSGRTGKRPAKDR